MNKKFLIVLILFLAACQEENKTVVFFCPQGEDLTQYVDPMIGTSGPGNVVVGPSLPHGMVKLSPDSVVEPGDVDAYEYDSDRIEGFSHTHRQGPGGDHNGYCNILFMPVTGPLLTEEEDYASVFSHDDEQAQVGYYSVLLSDYGVRAELTATAHAGYHRYTYPASDQARILIDLGHSRGGSKGGGVEIVDDRTVQGFGHYGVFPYLDVALSTDTQTTGDSWIYFYAVFSRPFASYGTFTQDGVSEGATTGTGPNMGAFVNFVTADAEVVEVKVGISLVSEAQARRNLEVEMLEKTFDEVREEAVAAWNCRLNRVRLEGGSEDQMKIFYTAFYHLMMVPSDYTEVDGAFFSGADGVGKVLTAKDWRYYTDDWCAWDTFRTSRPLATILEPEIVDDVVASYLHIFEQGGWLPKCTWHATGTSRMMTGNHGVSIVADAFVKGFQDYDLDLLWKALYKSATEDDEEYLYEGICGILNIGTPPEYVENGYVSHQCDMFESASMTLEYAYNDWCIARVAEGLDKADMLALFEQRAKNYRNVFNPFVGFMQGKNRDGTWVEPFDPANSERVNDFCEGNSWIYSFFVPHDVEGLADLFGGRSVLEGQLDAFFAGGYFEPDNEPSFHIPWLYNYVGAASKTQALVRDTLEVEFAAAPPGLPGNDDAGATSAWYMFGAMGFYPVAPGESKYQINSPLFNRITILLDPGYYKGETFVIEAADNSSVNLYIQSAELNGQPLDRTWITHEEIAKGGTLHLQMGPEPSSWGG
ncbi:MAG: GH92 family glycosyl hydrolase [Deltaproteobacteria bacterium]|nr:GH92 family glycosyl hydrolase [Deltaproteobacteria bacterium]